MFPMSLRWSPSSKGPFPRVISAWQEWVYHLAPEMPQNSKFREDQVCYVTVTHKSRFEHTPTAIKRLQVKSDLVGSQINILLHSKGWAKTSLYLLSLLHELTANLYANRWKNPLSYLPTPPLGQDMTQGQFLSGV